MEYSFSIVMAVYNVELYLREAVDSIIAQDIGFENIQLILVDDGSPDGSGAICDEYAARFPENILAIHKENGGVSSARNAGLSRASGRYVNFMDSDDMLTPDTLSRVSRFFETHGDETDAVSIPMIYFDSKNEEHVLNDKFRAGERVIDLKTEWTAAQLSASSAFFKREALVGLEFDERLHYMEDAKFVHRVLFRKETLGAVPAASYLYRRRSGGQSSAAQGAVRDPRWYLPRLRYYFGDTIRYFIDSSGNVPRYVQFVMMYDIQWIFAMEDIPHGILSPEDETEYRRQLYGILRYIDDEVILAQKHIKIERKLFALRKKHGRPPEIRRADGDIGLCYAERTVANLSDRKVQIDFIRMTDDFITVEGRFNMFAADGLSTVLTTEYGGTPVCCELFPDKPPLRAMGEEILDFFCFRTQIPVGNGNGGSLRFGLETEIGRIGLTGFAFGRFSGLSTEYKNAYYARGGWCARYKDHALHFSRVSRADVRRMERRLLRELLLGKPKRSWRGFAYRTALPILLALKRRPLWLISERESAAGDNGEAFFRYMAAAHPEIDARFILLKESPAYAELSRVGKMVPADSLKRKLLSLICDYQISSQAEWVNVNPFAPKDVPLRDILADKRFIFLQHGITQNDVSFWLKKDQRNIYGFITAAVPERDAIITPAYRYTEKEVWLTGFPRFDRLTSVADPRQITVMPTWRKYLMGKLDARTNRWTLAPGFTTSDYYSFYSRLISSPRLLRAAKEHGYRIAFFPHPNLQPYVSEFAAPEDVLLLGQDTVYRDVYAASALVVTDYSSAVFDFAYLRKPVLYAQFDRERFFGGDHDLSESYFDCERDGFGEVEYELEHLIDRIIEYIENGCRMKDEYRARADSFFAFSDRENCRRVYERLMQAGAQYTD